MKRHRSYGVLFVLALATTSATALAEKPKTPAAPASNDGYSYTFTDDALLGGGTDANGFRVMIPPKGIRVTLIRPRTSFIVELLKSVENL
jgi:hypothetical protein